MSDPVYVTASVEIISILESEWSLILQPVFDGKISSDDTACRICDSVSFAGVVKVQLEFDETFLAERMCDCNSGRKSVLSGRIRYTMETPSGVKERWAALLFFLERVVSLSQVHTTETALTTRTAGVTGTTALWKPLAEQLNFPGSLLR